MSRPAADSSLSFSDPLDAATMEALVTGQHGAPFDILGPHTMTVSGRQVFLIRAFLPGAQAVRVVPDGADENDDNALGLGSHPLSMPMSRLHDAGLFSLVSAHELPKEYVLEVRRPSGITERLHDPYAFPELITPYDLYLIGEGTHLELYERLGAHVRTVNGVDGVHFAVWAPTAKRVSVVGDFNGWDDRVYPMRLRSNGIWELFVPGVAAGALYKYAILSWNAGYRVLKADPLAFAAELRPGTASRVYDLNRYTWNDGAWMGEQRARQNALNAPISVYEIHAGSWRPDPDGGQGGHVTYRELAHQLVPYLQELGYTHVELMPIAEHPFDGSWGYQVTGYYAPTSRYGTPDDFRYFVDYLHQHGIGVLMDWVPAHFPRDEHGLAYFDGSHLYEHADPRQGAHPDWGTLVYNFGRNEVCNFLLANALFWCDKYHIDGLRVDAVASMLYLDYSRTQGQWLPNRYGGRENLEAIDFLRATNARVAERFPHVLMIAEESTAWPKVTHPVSDGGLGFSLKWNMGWMHDILEYIEYDPIYRRYHQNELTFSMIYAYSERFLLPFSHDEVVHMKGSMINKMPGDRWQKFANLRALYSFMYGHPGKKLLFMGGEFAQWAEWNYAGFLEWGLLDPQYPESREHIQMRRLVRDLNTLLRDHPSLHDLDFTPEGFEWIDGSDTASSVISFVRYGRDRSDPLVLVGNFTPVPRHNYRIGVPSEGFYSEVFNSDSEIYGGSNMGNLGGVKSDPIKAHGRAHSISLTLPPLAVMLLQPRAASPH